ncbi:DUF968 domain-containing protein [Kluyvera intermedia]|uniref:DUF968 domain-containing protein n=1 Tax=Kluyvera intermedia TaxID=61648 RepID=UPI00372CF27C
MRALLTPEIAPKMGIVLFRPGPELMPLFRQGRVLLESEPEMYAHFATGELPGASQPLAIAPEMQVVFDNERVLSAAGGLAAMENWLEKDLVCQWALSSYHSKNFTTLRHTPGVIRLCWHCDNQLREQSTERLAGIARGNLVSWILVAAGRDLLFPPEHVLTVPEFCWWLVTKGLVDVIPEEVARRALRLPEGKHKSKMRESEIVPSVLATSILQKQARQPVEAVKPILTLSIDPESPESFLLRPKRRRWVNEQYTGWVKTQPCEGCRRPADDPHHIVGHGMGGTATKAHDLFVIPLCRECHDELHAGVSAFEQKHGTQLDLLLRFLDRALAIGVISKA